MGFIYEKRAILAGMNWALCPPLRYHSAKKEKDGL